MDERHRRKAHERFQRLNARLVRLDQQLAKISTATAPPTQSVTKTLHAVAPACATTDTSNDGYHAQELARLRALTARRAIEHALVDAGLTESASAELYKTISAHLIAL